MLSHKHDTWQYGIFSSGEIMSALRSMPLFLFLSGCGFLPTLNYDRTALMLEGSKKRVEALDIESARDLSVGWRDTLQGAAHSRHKQELITKEVLFYGTVLFTASQAAIAAKGAAVMSKDLLHARNVAGGAAAGATLFSQHYQSGTQEIAFRKAASKMSCVTDAISDINIIGRKLISDDNFKLQKGLDDKPLPQVYDSIPRQIVNFVEHYSLPELRNDHASITLGTPSRENLMDIFKKYLIATETAGQNLTGGAVMEAATMEAAVREHEAAFEKLPKPIDPPAKADKAEILLRAKIKTAHENEALALIELKNMSDTKRADILRRFLTAVSTFSVTLETCKTGSG